MALVKGQSSNFVNAKRLVYYYTHFVYFRRDGTYVADVSQTHVIYAVVAGMFLCKNCSFRVG